MKTSTAVAIGVGVGLVTGAVIGGVSYAAYKGLKAALKHETYAVSLNAGTLSTSNKANVFFYPELKMSVIKVSPCKFAVPDSGSGTGFALVTSPFPADLVSDSAFNTTFKIPASIFRGEIAEGEYVVAKVSRNPAGEGVVIFSLATGADSEKQELPLHSGSWEITLPILITWEAK